MPESDSDGSLSENSFVLGTPSHDEGGGGGGGGGGGLMLKE